MLSTDSVYDKLFLHNFLIDSVDIAIDGYNSAGFVNHGSRCL